MQNITVTSTTVQCNSCNTVINGKDNYWCECLKIKFVKTKRSQIIEDWSDPNKPIQIIN